MKQETLASDPTRPLPSGNPLEFIFQMLEVFILYLDPTVRLRGAGLRERLSTFVNGLIDIGLFHDQRAAILEKHDAFIVSTPEPRRKSEHFSCTPGML